jgi:RPA family protein
VDMVCQGLEVLERAWAEKWAKSERRRVTKDLMPRNSVIDALARLARTYVTGVVRAKDHANCEEHEKKDTKINDDGTGSFTVVNYTVISSDPMDRTVTFAVILDALGLVVVLW